MAACPKCGSVIADNASFCGVCGSAVSPAGGAAVPPPPPAPPAATAATSTGMSSNVAGALCYLLTFITGIIFLVIEPHKRDRFVRFHAFQSIFFGVAIFVFNIVWSNIILGALSLGFLWTIFSLIGTLVYLAIFFLWLFLMYKAYNKEMYKLPFIGDLASKQADK